MRAFYMNLAVLALAASTISPALSAPTQYRYGNLLVEFKGQVFLISGIPLGSLGCIPIPVLMSFVVPGSLLLMMVIPWSLITDTKFLRTVTLPTNPEIRAHLPYYPHTSSHLQAHLHPHLHPHPHPLLTKTRSHRVSVGLDAGESTSTNVGTFCYFLQNRKEKNQLVAKF